MRQMKTQQKRFKELQQKLKLRREIDYDIQNLIFEEFRQKGNLTETQKMCKVSKYQNQLAESELKYRNYIEEKLKLKNAQILHERPHSRQNMPKIHTPHISKEINPNYRHGHHDDVQLKLEEDEDHMIRTIRENELAQALMESQRAYRVLEEEMSRYEVDKTANLIQYTDEQLLQHYEDGTRAKQIQGVLDSYRHGQHLIQGKTQDQIYLNQDKASKFPVYHDSLRGKESYQFPRKRISEEPINEGSPITKIKWENTLRRSSPYLDLNKNSNSDSPLKQEYLRPALASNNTSRPLKPHKKAILSTTFNPKTDRVQRKGLHNKNKMSTIINNSINCSKMSEKNKKKNPSAMFCSYMLEGKKKRKTVQSKMEEKNMKKIKKRLECSRSIFKDSKYRNMKHEYSHLENTFENEIRLRKEIKDRINRHPSILKKYNMVVQ